MTRLTLALLALVLCLPTPARAETPQEIVKALESRYGIHGALDRAWARECSRRQIGASKHCRNHRIGGLWVGERGVFQMTKSAAEHPAVKCNYRRLGQAGGFGYDAECAAKYLLYWTLRCGDQQQGEIAYVRGFCSTVKKVASR